MNKSILCITLYVVFGLTAKALVYYVDPANGGSNANSGFLGSPWATIQKAASAAEAGDTVFVQAGLYVEKVTFTHSGTEDALITFIGVGSVVVEGTSSVFVWSGIFNIDAKSYIRIQHFTLQNSYWFGIYVEASDHIYLEDNSTYNTGASGISVWHSSDVYAGYNTVRKACYQSLSTGSQECITFSGVRNFAIHHNEVYESGGSTNGGEGIDAKEDCSNGKIYNNQVHDLIRLGIYADSWDKALHDIDIYNNRVYKCSDGIVLSSENGGTTSNVRIFNNLTYNNKNFGIVISDFSDGNNDGFKRTISIMNNTIYGNGFSDGDSGWGGGIMIYSAKVSDISIFNNIVSQNDAMQIADKSGVSTVVVNKNLIYGYRGLNWTNEVKGTHAMEIDPLFRDADGADNIAGNADDDLNVTGESSAINAGENTNAPSFDFNYYVRPSEGVVDMGAYESNSIQLATKKSTRVAAVQLIHVYPNPGNDHVTIKLSRQVDLIEIMDHTGLVIKTYPLPVTDMLQYHADKPGMYLIRASTATSVQTLKVLFQ